jgi:hypothetical protein
MGIAFAGGFSALAFSKESRPACGELPAPDLIRRNFLSGPCPIDSRYQDET